jgi:hypothetical protein
MGNPEVMKMADFCSPLRGVMGSKHSNWISDPLKTRLSNPKRICARTNTTEINIDLQVGHVILQQCRARRAQNLVARFRE